MPPKGKAAAKPKETETSTSKPEPPPPSTVNQRTQQRIEASNSYAAAVISGGLSNLSPTQRTLWINSRFAQSPSLRAKLGTKAQRDLWRHVNDASLPLRTLRPIPPSSSSQQPIWGTDKTGRDVGTYSPPQFDAYTERRAHLTSLLVLSRAFADRRDRADREVPDPITGDPTVLLDSDIAAERARRREMADLRAELYGEKRRTKGPSYALDPEWDDVVPIALEEPDGALASIAYPEAYAEAISYLRAVMMRKEYSARCLRLTADIINLNPAHYTVWLYRASILFALGVGVEEEMEWLNGVALENLKNYQIWHHRHLLVERYFPEIEGDEERLGRFAKEETEFISRMLEEDTKNYHVWSYRSFLVRKLGLWRMAGERERRLVEGMIDEDVRNNSAWSHRFFVVFSDPEQSTPGKAATEYDPAVPAEVVEREIRYALDKAKLAPQNQSAWNYLRGVLVKGGRKLASVQGDVEGYVKGIGGSEEEEDVTSTHALDLLAEIYAEKGEKDKADLCLRRLAEKWDPIRAGYWGWRRSMLDAEKEG